MKLKGGIYPMLMICFLTEELQSMWNTDQCKIKKPLNNLLISKQNIHIHIRDEEPNVHREGEREEERIKGENCDKLKLIYNV